MIPRRFLKRSIFQLCMAVLIAIASSQLPAAAQMVSTKRQPPAFEASESKEDRPQPDPRFESDGAALLPESDSGKTTAAPQSAPPQPTPVPVFPTGSQPSLMPLPPVPAPARPSPAHASPAIGRAESIDAASIGYYYPMRVVGISGGGSVANSRTLLVKDSIAATFTADPQSTLQVTFDLGRMYMGDGVTARIDNVH